MTALGFMKTIQMPSERTWDRVFFQRLKAAAERGVDILIEPGSGAQSRILIEAGLEKAYRIGMDIDPYGTGNQHISAFSIGDISRMPFKSETADLIVSQWVLEHVEKPIEAANECYRVLKSGGRFISVLPNVANPAFLFAKYTPDWVHSKIRGLTMPEEYAENCLTYYRVNTPWKLRKIFESAGFKKEMIYCTDQAYTYLAFSKLLNVLGLLCGRITDIKPLRWLKGAMVAEFVKP